MRALLTLLLALLPSVALADGWYFAIGAGQARARGGPAQADSDAALLASGFNVDSSRQSTGDPLLVPALGYRFGSRLAAEIGYADLPWGTQRYSAIISSGTNTGTSIREWTGSGFSVSALATVPLRAGFSLIAKAGAMQLRAQYRADTLLLGPAPSPGEPRPVVFQSSEKAGRSSTLPVVGLGLAFGSDLQLRAMFERWHAKRDMFGQGNDLASIDLASLTLAVAF